MVALWDGTLMREMTWHISTTLVSKRQCASELLVMSPTTLICMQWAGWQGGRKPDPFSSTGHQDLWHVRRFPLSFYNFGARVDSIKSRLLLNHWSLEEKVTTCLPMASSHTQIKGRRKKKKKALLLTGRRVKARKGGQESAFFPRLFLCPLQRKGFGFSAN